MQYAYSRHCIIRAHLLLLAHLTFGAHLGGNPVNAKPQVFEAREGYIYFANFSHFSEDFFRCEDKFPFAYFVLARTGFCGLILFKFLVIFFI